MGGKRFIYFEEKMWGDKGKITVKKGQKKYKQIKMQKNISVSKKCEKYKKKWQK